MLVGSLAAAKVILEIAGPLCLDHRDEQNRSALSLATMGGHGEVINYFLNNGGGPSYKPAWNEFITWGFLGGDLSYFSLIIS